MLDLYEELVVITRALDEAKIEYALCGGLAMAVWSVPRATVDIALLIRPDDLDRVYTVAETVGYHHRALPMTFRHGAVMIRRVTKIDPDARDTLVLDLPLVTGEIEDVWENRERVSWDRGTLSVVSRDGLIKLKRLRSSGQDLVDIERLQEES